MCQFLVKMNKFEFFDPNLSKKGFRAVSEKSNVGTKINIAETLCVPVFSQTLTFLVHILPKMDLGSGIQKTNVGIRISIIKMPCIPIFRENGQL